MTSNILRYEIYFDDNKYYTLFPSDERYDNIVIVVKIFLLNYHISTKKIVSSDPIEKKIEYYNLLERWVEELGNTCDTSIMIRWISLFFQYKKEDSYEVISYDIQLKKNLLITKCNNLHLMC